MIDNLVNLPFYAVYETNDTDALVPEHWALEGLNILMSNMVATTLVHRDFSDEIAQYGAVVNTRKPSAFGVERKTNADDVTIQNAEVTNIPVTLNQHLHVSFLIRDGEESKAFKDLVAEFLEPAMIAQAEFIDSLVLGQVAQFLTNWSGGLQSVTAANAQTYLLDTRRVMNDRKVPTTGRNLVISSATEAAFLGTELFVSAEKTGDQGTALREASLGRKFGFDIFMCQNTPFVSLDTVDTATGSINNSGGYAKGVSTLTVTVTGYEVVAGSYVTIAGEMKPHVVASVTASTDTTGIVLVEPLEAAVAHGAVVTVYKPAAVDLSAGYLANYAKKVHIDTVTSGKAPQVGQIVSFGVSTARHTYVILSVTNTAANDYDLLLDRPLVTAISDGDDVFMGPAGSFNLAFSRNAIALVTRPLAMPRQGTGALAAVMNVNGVGLRVVITYDGIKQGTLVTLDCLLGVKVMDTDLGAVMLG